MSRQHLHQTIEAYLDGALNPSELKAFEQQLQSDPDLVNEVALFQNLDTALSNKPALNFQKIVAKEGKAFTQSGNAPEAKVKKISWFRRRMAIAATFLVLVVSIALLWQIQFGGPATGDELFAQHFETYSLNQSMRSLDSGNENFTSGVQQYLAKDFSSAAQTFKGLVEANSQDMVLAFSLAHAYLNQTPPELELAEEQFQKIISDNNSVYVPKAKWYKALILLKKDQQEQAVILLKDVAKTGDDFGKQAQVLLEDLGR